MKHRTKVGVAVVAAATLIAIGSATGAAADRLLTGADIKNQSITTKDLADGTVTSRDLADGTIASRNLAAATIRSEDLSPELQAKILAPLAPGLTYHEFDAEVRAGVQSGAVATAVCPSSKVAIGGGYELTSPDTTGWTETASFPAHVDGRGIPTDARNAWIVKLSGPAGQTIDVTVYASCAYDFQ